MYLPSISHASLLVLSRIPSCPHQVLRLDAQRAHLSIFGALLDVCDQLLLLILKLHALAVKLSLRLLECALVLPQSFGRGHALPEGLALSVSGV
jgi:hypothetical protein